MKIEMTKVLEYLKPKVKALGFKKEDLESVAADIADNLEVEDEASDEDVNAAVKTAVDAVIPSLKIAQKMANRAIEDYRKKQEKANEPKDAPKDEPEDKPKEDPKKEPSSDPSTQKKNEDEIPAWAKALLEQNKKAAETIERLQSEVTGMKSKSIADVRKGKLEELLKDTGIFGKNIIKGFERMKFESDEEFDKYFEEIKEDLAQMNQERESEGLRKFGVPAVEQKKEDPKPQVISEAELEDLAEQL